MEISLLTDIGQKRSNNQDYVNKYDNKVGSTLVILADGMGGHRAGNIASEMTVTDLGAEWVGTELKTLPEIRDWFAQNIEDENKRVYELGLTEDYQGMGTTIEAVAIVDDTIIYAHVGDSRIGLVHDGVYQQLTSDHSLVNELYKAGQITKEEAENHPQKNIITQSIGQSKPVEPDMGIHQLAPDDYLVVNSDGLTNMVSNDSIVEVVLGQGSLKEKAQELVNRANNAGGLDNITVALLHANEEDR